VYLAVTHNHNCQEEQEQDRLIHALIDDMTYQSACIKALRKDVPKEQQPGLRRSRSDVSLYAQQRRRTLRPEREKPLPPGASYTDLVSLTKVEGDDTINNENK